MGQNKNKADLADLDMRAGIAAHVLRSGFMVEWGKNRSADKIAEKVAAITNKIIEKLETEQNKP